VTNPLQQPAVEVHGFRLFRGGHALQTASAREIAAHLQRASADADILFVDLPPALAHATHAAVLRHPNTQLLIVPQLEPGAIQPAQRLAAMARQRKVPFHVLGNQLDRRRGVTAAVAQGLYGMFPHEMLPIMLPDVSIAMSCILARTPLPLYRPKAEIARALGIVARAILPMGGG
jgi:MinD-like ATPase involved in chromosome partitioning or flagellar assembly